MAFRKEEREMDLSLTFGEIRDYCSLIDSEFGKRDRHGYEIMEHGIEFMLSEKTRKDWRKEQEAMN